MGGGAGEKLYRICRICRITGLKQRTALGADTGWVIAVLRPKAQDRRAAPARAIRLARQFRLANIRFFRSGGTCTIIVAVSGMDAPPILQNRLPDKL